MDSHNQAWDVTDLRTVAYVLVYRLLANRVIRAQSRLPDPTHELISTVLGDDRFVMTKLNETQPRYTLCSLFLE